MATLSSQYTTSIDNNEGLLSQYLYDYAVADGHPLVRSSGVQPGRCYRKSVGERPPGSGQDTYVMASLVVGRWVGRGPLAAQGLGGRNLL